MCGETYIGFWMFLEVYRIEAFRSQGDTLQPLSFGPLHAIEKHVTKTLANSKHSQVWPRSELRIGDG